MIQPYTMNYQQHIQYTMTYDFNTLSQTSTAHVVI